MKKRRLMALLLTAVAAASLTAGCGSKKGKSSEDGVKEFTAFFAVPNPEINDDRPGLPGRPQKKRLVH